MSSERLVFSDRDARVDWLRGAAALLVLAYHLFVPFDWSGLFPLDHAARIAAWCWVGVPVFFVISGRCIAATWIGENDARRFALRRLRRIYPPYFASLLLCLAVALGRRLATGVNDFTALPATPGAILATLTLTTAPVSSVPTVNWVYWSLSCEVAYYVLLGALLFVPSGRGRLVAWLGLHALLCACDLAGLSANGTPLFFIGSWPLFGLGVGLALLPSFRSFAVASLSVSATHLLALAALGRFDVVHVAGLVTVAALLIPGRLWSPRAEGLIPRIGVFSYSLYLVHVPVGVFLVLRPVFQRLGETLLAGVAALLLAAAGSLAAAWLFHQVAEKPWMRSSAKPAP